MKQPFVAVLLALALIAGGVSAMAGVGMRSSVEAQESTPTAMSVLHPSVGAWMQTVDISEPETPPHLVIYHADGTYTDAAAGRGGGIGVWEAIDDTSVATNVLIHTEDDSGNVGLTRIRTIGEVDESGDAYTSEYTREVIAPDGTSTGELGPGTRTAERITVEARGEPAGPMTEE